MLIQINYRHTLIKQPSQLRESRNWFRNGKSVSFFSPSSKYFLQRGNFECCVSCGCALSEFSHYENSTIGIFQNRNKKIEERCPSNTFTFLTKTNENNRNSDERNINAKQYSACVPGSNIGFTQSIALEFPLPWGFGSSYSSHCIFYLEKCSFHK